jgi:hypothetical protein
MDWAAKTLQKTIQSEKISGNHFLCAALIVALRYNTGMAYVPRFFTHSEYDRKEWKDEL